MRASDVGLGRCSYAVHSGVIRCCSFSDECKTQKEELKDAVCACKEEHKTEVEAAFNKCTGLSLKLLLVEK